MDFLNRLNQQFQNFWTQLSGRQKVSLGVATALLFAGLMGLVFWANQVDYEPLFTNLKQEQMGPIIEELKTRKQPYKLLNGGTAVAVPADRVLELRMEMASSGVLKDGVVGFELFDSQGIGVTNFVEQLNYQRALQGELMRTINEIDGVESSRVHLVLPRDSLFVADQRPASASVVLKLAGGARLGREQVQGIINLVASSIEGLSQENVSVVDTEGRVLASPRSDSSAAVPGTLLEYQDTLERKLEERVQTFLERVVGQGKVIAKVQAALDMSAVETTSEVFTPESKVPRSEQNRTELRSNAAPGAVGVPGTTSNLPGNTTASTTPNTGVTIDKKESTTNYEIDKTTSRTVLSPGQLKRLSVAVIIDGTYKTGAAKAGEEASASRLEYTGRSETEMKTFEKIVRNAVGYNEERGDEVSVTNMQFHQLESDVPAAVSSIPWERPARYGMVLLGMFLVFFLIRPLLNNVAEEARAQQEASLAQLQAAGEAGALPVSDAVKLLSAGSQDKQRREEMINLARSDIDNTVQTVRDWLRTSS